MAIFRGAGTPASGASATFVTKEELADTTTDGTDGFNIVYYPPLSAETNVSKYQYYYGNPLRYGAIGTSDTTANESVNDTAFQAALDYIGGSVSQTPAVGSIGEVAVPAGIYNTSTQLEVWGHTDFHGEGMGTTIKYSGAGYAIRNKNDADFFTISKFFVWGGNNTSSLGGVMIGNNSTEDGHTAYASMRDVTIRGFNASNAIGLFIHNPSHISCDNISAWGFPSGQALRLTADMTGTGVIKFDACKFGDTNTTLQAVRFDADGAGRLDDISFDSCFFAGQERVTGVIYMKAPGPTNDPATDRYRNHHNISFNNCHAEVAHATSLGPMMFVESAIGLKIDGFQFNCNNQLAGTDATSAIKFKNVGWIKDIETKHIYAPQTIAAGNAYTFDWSGSGTTANIELEEAEVYSTSDPTSFNVSPASHNDIFEIPNKPRIKTNWTKNGDFSAWSIGSSSAPDFWTVSTDGSGSVTKSGSSKIFGNSLQLKMASGTYYEYIQDVDEYLYWKDRTVTVNGWVKTDIAGSIIIDDGVDTSTFTVDTGNAWAWITQTHTMNASATRLRIKLRASATSTDGVRFDGITLTAGGQGTREWEPNQFFDRRILQRSFTWNPASLADGAGETVSTTVAGAAFGDMVTVGAPYDLQDVSISAYVQAADTVEVRVQNESGGTRDLGNSTNWVVRVWKQ